MALLVFRHIAVIVVKKLNNEINTLDKSQDHAYFMDRFSDCVFYMPIFEASYQRRFKRVFWSDSLEKWVSYD